MTPTARTLQWLRKIGFEAGVVEKWIPQTKQRKDLFGFVDIVALLAADLTGSTMDQMPEIPPLSGVLGVQATSGSNHASRITKILESPLARLWIHRGNRLWVVSWAKQGAAGKQKRWKGRVTALKMSDFDQNKAKEAS